MDLVLFGTPDNHMYFATDDLFLRSSKNAEDIAALDAKVADAKEKFGETEVFEAQRDKADYFARVGDKASNLSGCRRIMSCMRVNDMLYSW